MSRSNSILVGTFAALVLAAIAIAIAPFRSGKGPGETGGLRSPNDVIASLPATAGAETRGSEAGRSEATASSPDSAPNSSLRDGKVTILGGGPVPSGTQVVVRYDNPDYFGDFTFAELMKLGFGRGPRRQRDIARAARANRRLGNSAEVAPDGNFRIEAPRAGIFYVDIESDSLFTDRWERQNGSDATALGVRARRGRALRGKVVSAEGGAVEGVELQWMDHALPRSTGRIVTPRDIRAKSAADGTFKLRALPIDGVGAVLARHPNYSAANVPCTADTTAGAFVVTLYAPAKIAGRVVDSAGLAVEGADLSLLGGDITSYAAGVEQDLPKSDAEGRFVILEAPPGHARVRAEKAGIRPCTTPEFDVRPGVAVDLGILVMQRGFRIEGQVLTPDGAAIEGAKVTLGFAPQMNQLEAGEGGATPGDSAEATTAAEGKFAFEGMGKGPYDVEANYPGFASARKKRYLADGRPLVLKLRRPGSVEVAVTWPADATAPAELEGILEVSQTIGPGFTMAEAARREKVKIPEGASNANFRIEDVAPGSYGLVVKARGFARAKTAGLEVKGAGTATASVALVPGVIASGIVVERGTKQPLAGARVMVSGTFFDVFKGDVASTDTKEDGTFELPDLESGPLSLAASTDGFSREIVSLGDQKSGAHVEGIEIALGRGGDLEGIAFDEEGFPMAGGVGMANAIEKGEFQQSVLDAGGRFRLRHLSPGNYQVTILRGSFLADVSGSNPNDMLKGMQISAATIRDGETTRIVIGREGGGLVKVRVHVTSRGEPVTGALVNALPQTGEGGPSGLGRARFSTTDDNGKFQIPLPPGKVVFTIQRGRGSQTGIEHSAEIPRAATHDIEITLPQGMISGLVRGPSGSPVAGEPVFIASDRGAGATLLGSFGQAATDEDGKYRFENLAAGGYLVTAGGVNAFSDAGGEAYGRVSQNVSLEDGQAASGVDFSLAKAGAIVGTVTARGEPLGGASIFLQTSSGQAVSRLSDVFSNAGGNFRARGIAPGTYRLLSRAKGFGFKVIEPVVVEAGRDTNVAIALEPGVAVTVQVTDNDGNPVAGANADLFDDQNRRLSGFAGIAEFADLFTQGAPPAGTIRLGELGPGRYKVRVSREGYGTAETDFTISDASPKTLGVRLEKK